MRTKGRCVTSCLVDMRRYLELLASCRRCFHTIAATNKYCVLYNPTVGQVSDLVLFQDRINVTLISCTSSTTNCSAPHSQQPVAKGGGHTRNANKGSVLHVRWVLYKSPSNCTTKQLARRVQLSSTAARQRTAVLVWQLGKMAS